MIFQLSHKINDVDFNKVEENDFNCDVCRRDDKYFVRIISGLAGYYSSLELLFSFLLDEKEKLLQCVEDYNKCEWESFIRFSLELKENVSGIIYQEPVIILFIERKLNEIEQSEYLKIRN